MLRGFQPSRRGAGVCVPLVESDSAIAPRVALLVMVLRVVVASTLRLALFQASRDP